MHDLKTNLIKSKSLYLTYLFLFILGIGAYISIASGVLSPLNLLIVFFAFLLLPGFSLGRLLNLLTHQAFFDKTVISISISLIFIFSLNFIAMFAGLSLTALIYITSIIIVILFFGALGLDLFRKKREFSSNLSWQNIWSLDTIVLAIFLSLTFLVILIASVQGTLVKGGDPSFHMSIVYKALEGSSLSATNLSLVKSSTLHITYGLPVWHIFIAFLGKLFRADLFSIWKVIIIPLSLLATFIWYWLARKIVSSKTLAIFIAIAFLVYILNKNIAYLFTCLPIPDTFNNLILLPLSLGLMLNFLAQKTKFNLKKDWLNLAIIVVLNIFMAIIHLTQYFYILIIIFVAGLVYFILFPREKDNKNILFKFLALLATNLLILLPLATVLLLKSNITKTLSAFLNNNQGETLPALAYHSFYKFNTLAKYAFIFSPFLLLLVRKNRNLVFIISLFLILPILYFDPIKNIFMKTLGYIFINRIYSSLIWHFVLWGIGFGFLFLLIDKLFAKISSYNKYLKVFVNILAGAALIAFIILENKFQIAETFYQGIYLDSIDKWMNHYYLIIILILTLIALIIFYFQNKIKWLNTAFELNEGKTFFIPILFIIYIGSMLAFNWPASQPFLNAGLQKKYLISAVEYDTAPIYSYAGGKNFVDFVNNNIPDQSVILVPGNVIFNLPLLTNLYMAGYPRSSSLQNSLTLYKNTLSDEEKIKQVKKADLDYIFLTKPALQGMEFFERNPEIFSKVYSDKSILYKVNKNKL